MTIPKLEYKWLVGIVFVMALFMDLLDITIINVAIPTLAQEFGASTTTIEWVVTGYLLSLALFIPISGWLGDRFGTKRIFVIALGIFVLGSLLSGLAWDIESLIAFRALQGVGGGMLTPVGFTLMFRAFPPAERAAASAVLAIPITVAPALGPILGGYLVDYQSWRWIFLVNVPVGLLALGTAILFLREDIQEAAGRLDLPGFVLSGVGLVFVVFALSEAGLHGFGDTRVLLFGLTGLGLLGLLTLVELRTEQPLLDMRLLKDKLFSASNLVNFAANGAQMGAFFVLPIFMQTQKGMDAFDVGLTLFPMAIGVAIMAQPAARFYASIGPRRMMMAGFVGLIASTLHLAMIDYGTANWLIAVNFLLRGMAFGLIIIPLQAAAFATITPEDTGRASSIFNVGRQVSASLGVAILATALTSRLGAHDAILGDPGTREAALTAFQDTFLIGAGLAAIGIIATLWIDDKKAITAAGGHVAMSEGGEAGVAATPEETAAG